MNDTNKLDEKKLDGATGGVDFPMARPNFRVSECPGCLSKDISISSDKLGHPVVICHSGCKGIYTLTGQRN